MTTATRSTPRPAAEAHFDAPPIRRDRAAQTWVAAATVSAAGDAVFVLALAWTAVHLFSATTAGLIVGVDTLPQALLTLAGGVLADRVDTRRLLLGGEVARAVLLVVAIPLWIAGHSASLLFTVALLFGVVAGLTNPGRGTLGRQLVRDDDIAVLSGWTQVGSRVAQLAGGPIGAVVVVAGGLTSAMLVDAVTFAATGIALATVVRPRRTLHAGAPESWRTSLGELRRYFRRDPVARALTLGICSLNVVVIPVTGIGVALRVSSAHWSAAWVGVADGICAVGAILGSAAAIHWRTGPIAARGFRVLVLQGAALAAVGLDHKATLVVAMSVVGVTSGFASVWLSTAFQRGIAGTHLGRVTSVSQLGDQLAIPVMLPVFGLLASHAGVLVATVVCGASMAALCASLAMRRVIRTLR
jgi:DHA3 family macrolide efflux protein-like MFS transporter